MLKMKKDCFVLKSKIIDIEAKRDWIILINAKDAKKYGVKPASNILIGLEGQNIAAEVTLTDTLVKPGEVGIFEDLAKRFKIKSGSKIDFSLIGRLKSLDAVQKNMQHGVELTYKEVYSIIEDIASRKLSDVAVAFFIASTFFGAISRQEMYFMTKAMAETGKKLKFSGMVVDKHSVGGLAGNETTPIIIPIIASFGLLIPKTSSRAITSASGTADTMEVFSPVSFPLKKLEQIVKKTNACLVWGVGDVTPSDSRIIDIASQLYIESFAKMVPSIIAKKAALDVKYLVIDIPVNPTAKIKDMKTANELKDIMEDITKRMGMKAVVSINRAKGPIGRGFGGSLQARDDMYVLEQDERRPLDLEKRAIQLSGILLEMTKKAPKGKGEEYAKEAIVSGKALKKFREIIKVQGGNSRITADKIKLGTVQHQIKANKSGKISKIHNTNLVKTCRLLGSPFIKPAGIYLEKRLGETVNKGDVIFTFHTINKFHLNLALDGYKEKEIFEIK